MIVRIPNLLSKDVVAQCRARLEAASWVDGRTTAGVQSARTKDNLQVPETSAEGRELGDVILSALGRNETFVSAALPLRVFPPLFNRYDAGMRFGAHVDNAIRFSAAGAVRFRTDISATLFLTEPEDYDGGDLIIQDTFGEHSVKLAAGDLVIYPAVSVHRVEPITRGSRWSSFFWLQSMIRDDGERALLYDLDRSIVGARAGLTDEHETVVSLTAVYHNLVRRWAEV